MSSFFYMNILLKIILIMYTSILLKMYAFISFLYLVLSLVIIFRFRKEGTPEKMFRGFSHSGECLFRKTDSGKWVETISFIK